jgi:GMP synthase-like glutamine amidotransferase
MQPPLASFGVLMSCRDQVEALPPGTTVLAGNEHCPVGMFRVGTMLGIQGHPEWTRAYAEALLVQRRERIGAERVDAALATLSAPVHARALAQWAAAWLSARR